MWNSKGIFQKYATLQRSKAQSCAYTICEKCLMCGERLKGENAEVLTVIFLSAEWRSKCLLYASLYFPVVF
jgi:hypothetical protein